jgi:translation initiation factor IF-2
MDEGRRRRDEGERARVEADAEQRAKHVADQQVRAKSVAEQALLQRQAAEQSAMEAEREEMELLARARKLRGEQEKKQAEEAARRAKDGTSAPAVPQPGPGEALAQRLKKRGRVLPTQVFGINDVVRKSTRKREDEQPRRHEGNGDRPRGPGGPGGPGGQGGPGGPGSPGAGGPRPGVRGRPGQAPTLQDRRAILRARQNTSIAARRGPRQRGGPQRRARITEATLRGDVTTRLLAEKLELGPNDIISAAFRLGEPITINQLLSEELVMLLGEELGVTLTLIPEGDQYDVEEQIIAADEGEHLQPRPPVITIMGHVDHGKTSLLDVIRRSAITEGEHGGITQHIGAYQVDTPRGKLTFLDTPGHQAFTAMRARGASVTDLVVLVVAADDGVMPQTVEAINHSKAAQVPIVVAVNKMDIEGADPTRLKSELMAHHLVSEELGGDTQFIEVSAKQSYNIDKLLEAISLQAELLDLKANPDRAAIGSVIESRVDPNRGAVATVLVQRGTLRAGDHFVVGDQYGRVRAMRDDRGGEISTAPPSTPVEIIGLTGSPAAGEQLIVLESEQQAREIAETRENRRRSRSLLQKANTVTLESFSAALGEGGLKDLNLILKGDVQGSVEAVQGSIMKIKHEQVRIRIVHAAVGGVSESDIQLAETTNAIVLAFNVRTEPSARDLASERGVDIKTYNIIYELLADVEAAVTGLLAPKYREEVLGSAEVLQVFRITKFGNIAGSIVRDGEIKRDAKVRVYRNDKKVYEGELSSLKRVKDDAKTVNKGLECGIGVKGFNDIKQGDIIEAFTLIEEKQTLESKALS